MKDAAKFVVSHSFENYSKGTDSPPANTLRSKRELGSVVLELVITLLFLFFFFLIYIQITALIMVHERISYSAYAGARVNVVAGNVGKAVLLTKGKSFAIMGDTVLVHELIKIPMNLPEIFKKNGGFFKIEALCTLPVEERAWGDN